MFDDLFRDPLTDVDPLFDKLFDICLDVHEREWIGPVLVFNDIK